VHARACINVFIYACVYIDIQIGEDAKKARPCGMKQADRTGACAREERGKCKVKHSTPQTAMNQEFG